MSETNLHEKDLDYWNNRYDDFDNVKKYREALLEGLKSESNPDNLYDFLDRSFWYLHEERVKYEFGLNEEKCKPISRGLLHCCKVISEKMAKQADVEYGVITENIKKCLNECTYYIPRDSQEYQAINQNINHYFSNVIDKHSKNPEVMLKIGKLISQNEDADIFEKYVNKVFEQYDKQKEVRENLLSVFADGYIFNKTNKLENNPYMLELLEQRLKGKDITNIDSIYDYINSKTALMHILKLPDGKSQSLAAEDALGMINKCSKIIEKYADDKEIAQSVSDFLFKIQTPEVMKEMSSLCKAISKSHSGVKVPSSLSFRKRLTLEVKALLAKGKLEEAFDKFAYITSSQAYKNATDDNIERVVQKMPNGCIAVGFLREKRDWDKPSPGWGASSGVEWKWYGQGFIVDPKKIKVVGQCRTNAVTVRDKYSANRDIYKHIDTKKIMEVDGNRLSVYIGGCAEASTEYNPKTENKKEESLARIKKNKDVVEQKTGKNVSSPAEATPAHSNSANSSDRNGRGGNGGFSEGR